VGALLLTGYRPRATRWLALACFAVFTGVSAAQAVGGASSCACFGRLDVNPWVMASVDGLIVALLLAAAPGRSEEAMRRFRLAAAGVVGVFVLAGATASHLVPRL